MADVSASRAFFGESLRAARESRMLTRSELAKRLGASASTVANAERGHRTPPYRDLPKWAAALEMDDGGVALQRAFRFSQGFLDEAVTGTGADRPFWDEAFSDETDGPSIDMRALRRQFDNLDWREPRLTKDRKLLVRLLCVLNFISVMGDLKPHNGCGFGQGITLSLDSPPTPWLVKVMYLPHGGKAVEVSMPNLDRMAEEGVRGGTQRPRSTQDRSTVVPKHLLDGLTESDIRVLRAVADGLRKARNAE